MNAFFLFLWGLSSALILSQWFVIVSLRRYLFNVSGPMTRRYAYVILAILGVLNVAGVIFSMEGRWLPVDSVYKKVAAVTFFSYLGLGLVLSLFFLVLRLLDALFLTARRALRSLGVTGDLRRIAENQRGCVSSQFGDSASVSRCAEDRADASVVQGTPSVGNQTNNAPATGIAADDLASDSHASHDIGRRSFLKIASVGALVAGSAVLGEGIVEAYKKPVTEDWDVPHPLLDGNQGPFVIIHATDFHFGLFYNAEDLAGLVDRLNGMEGDAVVFTGDIYHSPLTPVEDSVPILSKLIPRRIGNFAVLGNHEFYAGIVRCVSALESAGIRLLRNEWHTFSDHGATIHMGGLDDPVKNWLRGREFPKFAHLMKIAPSEAGMKVLLCHRPTILPEAATAGIDLVLSGHTHGGQVILPSLYHKRGLSLARVVSPFTHGWYRDGNTKMYLNRGVGLTFVPWRINCPPEIAVLRLGNRDGRLTNRSVPGSRDS
jgi:hypothetical protein